MKTTYRQGDVLFVKIEKAGNPTKMRRNGHIMEGKVTGHIHRVADADLEKCELFDSTEKLFLNVSADSGVSIIHEDHATLELPAGQYEVIRQREYSPEAIRNVAD
jgi:hypothetical protein